MAGHTARRRWTTVVASTIGLVPLVVSFSFALRTASVAQRTASVAPFSPGRDYRP